MASPGGEPETEPTREPEAEPTREIAGQEVRALILAGAAWLGADLGLASLSSLPVLIVSVALIGVGLTRNRFLWLTAGAFGLLSFLGARADASYVPMTAGIVSTEATVVGDPHPAGPGWQAEFRLADGRRVEVTAYGPTGWDLSAASVGEVYRLVGRSRPPGQWDGYRVRHISGMVAVDQLDRRRGPGPQWWVPEAVRNLIVSGGSTMSERHRALYLGLVIGDDRFQPLGQRLNFRSAGLTHLLAVSGQNVAFVLAVARWPLQLLGRRGRLAATGVALLVFALVTRMEPSVLRATAMALLAVWAAASGRERSGVVLLALAVTGLLCLDPFLVDSVGFQLSVGASLGILLLSPALERRLPGPGWVTTPAATTITAQLGVAPLLSLYFGPISIVSVPANLMAGWAAAAVMTLGLTTGLAAGVLPGAVGSVLQEPTVLLLRWLDLVAAVGGRSLLPRFGPLGLTTLVVAVVLAGPGRSRSGMEPARQTRSEYRAPVARRGVAALVVAVLLAVAWPTPPDQALQCGAGMTWYPSGSSGNAQGRSVLIIEPSSGPRSVASCLDHGVRSADVVVAVDGGAKTAELVAAVREVMRVGQLLAPPQHRIVGARRVLDPVTLAAGHTGLRLSSTGDGRLVVDEVGAGGSTG